MGIVHEPHVTGGDAAKHPSFLAANTALGNIRHRHYPALITPSAFRKCAHRYLGQVQYPQAIRTHNVQSLGDRQLQRSKACKTPCACLHQPIANYAPWVTQSGQARL
jgi:hypothetical protein